MDSDLDWQNAMRLAAGATDKYLMPYVRGEVSDISGIQAQVKKKADEIKLRIKGYKFPKNVKPHWE